MWESLGSTYDVSWNALNGSIVDAAVKLPALVTLDLSGNAFSGAVPSPTNLGTNLR